MGDPGWIGPSPFPDIELQKAVGERDATIAELRAELSERSDRRAVLRERMARLEAEAEATGLREQLHALRTQSRADLEAEVEYLRDEVARLKRSRERTHQEALDRLRVHCEGGEDE